MNRRVEFLACLLVLTLAGASGLAQGDAEPTFTLGFKAEDTVLGNAGALATFGATATLTTEGLGAGDAGAQAWQIAIGVEGCSIVGATTDGTIADHISNGGLRQGENFHTAELIKPSVNNQGQGAISVVVLSLDTPVTLPPQGTVDILALTFKARIPEDEAGQECHLFYVDGQLGSGLPVKNRITYLEGTRIPEKEGATMSIEPIVDCSERELALIFQDESSMQTSELGAHRLPPEVDVAGTVGEVGETSLFVGIVSQLPPEQGVQAWSLSLASENLSVVDITWDGTVAETIQNGGLRTNMNSFAHVEVIEPDMGGVSAVVLSYNTDVTLEPTGTATVLGLTVASRGPIPESGQVSGRLRFRDGLQGQGRPVPNVASVDGSPSGYCAFRQQELRLNFVDSSVRPLALMYQDQASGQTAELNTNRVEMLEVQGRVGEKAQSTAYVAIVSQLPQENGGVDAWSLSLAADGLVPTAATTDGTVAADFREGGLMRQGFNYAEVIDPALNDGQRGVVAASVLSHEFDVALEPTGSATVLRVDFESEDVLPEEKPVEILGHFHFQGGLRAQGLPVPNTASVDGKPAEFCCPEIQVLTVNFVPLKVGQYVPGDANADGSLNIADPIWLISALFRGGPPLPCPDAGDANNDTFLDLSDVAWVIDYQYTGGPPPPQGLECILDEESTADTCPFGSTPCDG